MRKQERIFLTHRKGIKKMSSSLQEFIVKEEKATQPNESF